MGTKHYDLVVIGSGPAGEKGAAQAAYFGKKVALIEKEPVLGGAAANTGTLPSKTLRETALYLSGFRQRGLHAVHFQMKEALTPRHSPSAHLHADKVLIATGSHPFHPANFPFHDSRVYDSDNILNLREIPATMLVAGGGVIGCEYACMFAALGLLDAEVSHALRADRARANHRRQGWVPEPPLPRRGHEAAGRGGHRRAGERTRACGPHRTAHGGGRGPLHPDLLQLPDAVGAIQIRDV